ncbi:hypothetical protein N7462_009519 [Penicillium macrosclerotiorum]|uniref:uncharacterized protein n=1 Tax=Penicillium macrosclerotiorum TaxID=303699 RepID=UPI00254885DE|nr:uncharacterized protein N7462_009519 [Penicillium macrosclerotiorum]KAJ5674080.1 hypothetical protein N7462_009519 [Penicillium macrosclerotiorum]
MPLHLLGKKSWNVYNSENIARVKRDEAEAKAREEEDERRMQEVDAKRRIQILRGERPSTPPPPPPIRSSSDTKSRPDREGAGGPERYRKKRRLAGEDDTDRDIRLAREDAAQAHAKREELLSASRSDDKKAQVPLLDNAGHINLFPAEGGNRKAEKNAEAEAEAEKERQGYENQYMMRFSNAAGFKEDVGRKPWYSSSAQALEAPDSMSQKNVWGNEDPRRKEREKARMDASDPLMAMKQAVRQLKATEQERKRWNENKQRELEALKAEESRSSRHRRRRRSKSIDSFGNFKLDAPAPRERDDKEHRSSRRCHENRHHHGDRSRHRSRSRSRSRHRSHRSSRHSLDRSYRRSHDRACRESRHSRKSEKTTAER